MSYKTLRLSSYTHDVLNNLKGKGESFDDLVKRLISNISLTSAAGLWAELSVEEKKGVKHALWEMQTRGDVKE
jgi:hypothetical protein